MKSIRPLAPRYPEKILIKFDLQNTLPEDQLTTKGRETKKANLIDNCVIAKLQKMVN